METAVAGLQEAQSFSFWLMSTMVAYLRESGCVPPDEGLYNRLTSSLSTSLVDQAKASFGLSAFFTLSRRAHFLKFAASTVSEGQRSRLLTASPYLDKLFDEGVLGEVVKEYEGAAATTSHLDLSKAVAKGLFFSGKRKHEETQASPGSPLVPHGSASTSKANVAAMFKPKYGKGRGQRKGGRGGQRGGKGGASTGQKPSQDFGK